LEIQLEYRNFELRDLISIPLKLTLDQKKDFIDLTLERFWTYQGRYYFIDNNCGTEAVKHLGVVISDSETRLIRSTTPLRLYKDIIESRNNFTEIGLDSLSREELIHKGFLTESIEKNLETIFEFLKRFIPNYQKFTFKEFLKLKTALDRFSEYQKLLEDLDRFDLTEQKQIVMRILYLERFLTSKYVQVVTSKMTKNLLNDEVSKTQIFKLKQDLKIMGLQPWEIIDSSYGVPSNNEFLKQQELFFQERQLSLSSQIESHMKTLLSILNKNYFKKELNELNYLMKINDLTKSLIIPLNDDLIKRGTNEK
jgi:hypothetical protein